MEHKEITFQQIYKLSESKLIIDFIYAGLPHANAQQAFVLLQDAIKNYIETELDQNGSKNLVLVLTGFSSDKELFASAVLPYALTLSTTLGLDYDKALKLSEYILPEALQCVGDHLPWSKMNQRGLSELMNRSQSVFSENERSTGIKEFMNKKSLKALFQILF